MRELAEALPWVAFWAVIGLCVWIDHKHFTEGYDAFLFEHKTDEEKRIREAKLKKLEAAAHQPAKEPK